MEINHDSLCVLSLLYLITLSLSPYICATTNTFNHYTFYYEQYHYNFLQQPFIKHNESNSIYYSLIDDYNNSIIFNSSLLLTINNEIVIDYFNDNDWNEIHHQQLDTPTTTRRRLFLGKFRRKATRFASRGLSKGFNFMSRKFRKVRKMVTKLFGKLAIPPPRHDKFWQRRWVKKGRYIGYYPGYKNQKGLPYKKAERYCDVHYGGLATIMSKSENKQVFDICKQLLTKYKKHKVCKRKCRYILFRGTKCWTHCSVPFIQRLHTYKYWKGHNCWIGIKRGPSSDKDEAFTRWNDMRYTDFKNWSPGEPNFRKKKHCKTVYGGGDQEQTCETKRIYDEKCGEILAYRAGHIIVQRSASEKKLFRGVPPDVQQAISPKPESMFQRIEKASMWNNAPCQFSRVPICQKPRGQVYDKYIAVRAARSYAVAQQYCHGMSLFAICSLHVFLSLFLCVVVI